VVILVQEDFVDFRKMEVKSKADADQLAAVEQALEAAAQELRQLQADGAVTASRTSPRGASQAAG
jgi:hypothetical protein